MKQFRVKLKKVGSGFMIRLPKMISDRFNFRDGDEIEISILAPVLSDQGDLWEKPPKEITEVSVTLSEDTHSLNMYNRIYIPAKLRFFFPPAGMDFILRTNVGNFTTHLTSDGFIKKNIFRWFSFNGPLEAGDRLDFIEEPGPSSKYRMVLQKQFRTPGPGKMEKK
ncbi:MAG: AbrB/MazE/SpoVT family DNA-binding domain-containing protein [FCB group bacterium]|nr:AbrB/MazE/SpoVT family DNA-binding domain-containing protein [FCB group bacterium]